MKRALVFLSIATALLTTGCTVYHPQAVDIPLLSHAGETHVDAGASMSFLGVPDALNLNVTASHAFPYHVAGQVHANYGGDNWYLQAAPGVYATFGGVTVVEAYAGLGYGGAQRDSENGDDVRTSRFEGTYKLPFVQLNAGWRGLAKGHIDFGFGFKGGAFIPDYWYEKYNEDGTVKPGSHEAYTTTNALFEPQMMFRIGGEHVKFSVKTGVAFMSDIHETSYFEADWFTLSAGLTFHF